MLQRYTSLRTQAFLFYTFVVSIMAYSIFKALHLIFMVTWFAGLFYIVRLFIYQTEAEEKREPEKSILRDYLKKIQKPLWFGITWPGMIFTVVFGSLMLIENPAILQLPFMHAKLGLVLGLISYHLHVHFVFKQLQVNIYRKSSIWLRFWNEVATIFLFAIIFVIVLKQNFNYTYGLIGLVLLCGLITWGVFAYKRKRKNQEK